MERSKEKSRLLSCPGKTLFLPWFSPEDCGIWPEICQFGFTLRSPLKSVYNTIVAAFSDCGLFFEADFYLEKMMDIFQTGSL